jgi:hypothetical protein
MAFQEKIDEGSSYERIIVVCNIPQFAAVAFDDVRNAKLC